MKTYVVVLVCLCFTFPANYCLADDYSWINPDGGVFGDPNNWDPAGVPGSSEDDTARFPLPAAYTVTMDADYYNSAMRVDGSDLTLNLDGHRYFLYLLGDNAVVVGESGQGSLMINNGEVVGREMTVGLYGGSVGSLALSGPDARCTAYFDENWYGITIGMGGDATLSICDNAHLMHGNGATAYNSESDAVVEVNDIDSEWYVDGLFEMSVNGNTTVDVRNGGMINIGKLIMATESGSSAQINITGQDHESELQLHADWENSLAIGKSGHAGIRVDGSKIWNQGSMTIAENQGSWGLLDIHEGSWVDCGGAVAVGGTLDNSGGVGQIKITDEDRTNGEGIDFTPTSAQGQSMVVWPLGTIAMDGGVIEMENADSTTNPIILRGGTLEGSGMIWADVENHGGLVAPRDDQDQKTLEIGYNYTQNSSGILKITIGGPDISSQYSTLQVNHPAQGQVSLDGMLNVELENNYVPNYNDQFIIVTATSVTGTFSNAQTRYVFENGSFEVIYNTDSVILTHFSTEPACPKYPVSDLSKDCRVNLEDFAIFAGQWLDCNLVPDSYCAVE